MNEAMLDAAYDYRDHFDQAPPTFIALPPDKWDEATDMLKAAIKDDKPIDAAEWNKKFEIDVPDDAVI